MVSKRPGHIAGLLILIISVLAPALALPSAASVDLSWRPSATALETGATLNLELFATSQHPGTISAVDVIITWDPAYLKGINKGPAQPFWLVDGFLNPQPDGLNADTSDGSVLYTAWSGLFTTVSVDSGGLLLAAFSFTALQPVTHTTIAIPAVFGTQTHTAVYDGSIPNTNVTGELGSLDIAIVPEPSSACVLALVAPALRVLRRRP